jgi:Flp pilus assembly protein TadG
MSRKGSLLLEFTLLGIPVIFMTLSVFEVSMTMWQFHTLEQCAVSGARYVITHGSNCSATCPITVGNVVTRITQMGIGLDPAKLSITLASASASTTYSPASSYLTNGTTFPPSADSTAGKDITVTVKQTISNPFVLYWPGQASVLQSAVTVSGTSRQRIVF